MKKIIIALAIALPLLASCSDFEETPYLSISKAEMTIPAEGGADTVKVIANYPFTVSCDNTDLTITPDEGFANKETQVIVKAGPNANPKDIIYYVRINTQTPKGSQYIFNTIIVTQKGVDL